MFFEWFVSHNMYFHSCIYIRRGG